MRVRAVERGYYDNIEREPGEVFDLLMNADGSMPCREEIVWATDKDGKKILDAQGRGVPDGKRTWKDEADQPMHRDFSPHTEEYPNVHGEVPVRGWMEAVDDRVAVGLYPPETNFEAFAAQPMSRAGKAVREPIHTKPKGSTDRPRH